MRSGAGRAQLATSRVTRPVLAASGTSECVLLVVRSGHGVACRSVTTSPSMVTTSCLSSTGGWPIQPVRVYSHCGAFQENRDGGVRRGFLAVFLTRGHPTARFLNRMSAVFTPLKRQNERGAGKGCWGGLGGSMACCILGPPTLSTFPASMCSLRATWADEAISQVQNAGRKGQVWGSKGPSFLFAGSARRDFLAPRAKAHAGFS